MYPTLETERVILKPLADDDFLDMFTLFSNPDVVVTMEGEVQSDRSKYEKEFVSAVRSGGFWTIWSRETDDFLGYFQMHHYINRNKGAVRYSQMGAAKIRSSVLYNLSNEKSTV
jgi:RimJ/RimL family protein N-acetyltransferase